MKTVIEDEISKPDTEFLKRLYFRRQFILGPVEYSPNDYWSHYELKHDLFLSVHIDLRCYFFLKKPVSSNTAWDSC